MRVLQGMTLDNDHIREHQVWVFSHILTSLTDVNLKLWREGHIHVLLLGLVEHNQVELRYHCSALKAYNCQCISLVINITRSFEEGPHLCNSWSVAWTYERENVLLDDTDLRVTALYQGLERLDSNKDITRPIGSGEQSIPLLLLS